MKDNYLRSHDVAYLLGSYLPRLLALIRRGRIRPAPARDPLGHYQWSKADIERARKAISEIEALRIRRKDALSKPDRK